MELKTTPLYSEHKRLFAQMAPFGGWQMPIQYSGIIDEHIWTRSNASLFDICHMGEFIIEGDLEKSNLGAIVTANLESAPLGKCRYCFMLNSNGGIIDDLVVYKISQEKWMLVVNAATTDKDEAHLRKNLARDARLENISLKLGKLDLQGPLSREVLNDNLDSGVNDLKYYAFSSFNILGEENIISRSGYTGELGFELYLSNEKIKDLWNLLLKDKRVKPAGLGARDTLRLESGYSLYGQDINQDINPLEAGLERFVDFNKDFIGKTALLEQKKKGIKKRLVGFITNSRRAARHNYKIYSQNQEIGLVTSGSFSPSLSCGIGMGYISLDKKIGDKLLLKEGSIEIEAVIAEKPFYKKGSLKLPLA